MFFVSSFIVNSKNVELYFLPAILESRRTAGEVWIYFEFTATNTTLIIISPFVWGFLLLKTGLF